MIRNKKNIKKRKREKETIRKKKKEKEKRWKLECYKLTN